MIPFGNETVTLIRRNESVTDGKIHVSYSAHVINGCTWRRTTLQILNGTQTEKSVQTTCRMPPGIIPRVGDALFLGTCETPANAVELAEMVESNRNNGAFFITAVKDNARPGMPIPHYAARGE